MKKIIVAIITLSFIFTACAKEKKADSTSQQTPAVKEENKQTLTPEQQKLISVLGKMSQRCRDDMPNGNPDELLQDLHKVLQEEENFTKDDISLYYLIDKKHNIGSQYEPKNLVKLVKNNDYAINRNDLSLRPDVEAALRTMAQAAKQDGITLLVSSTYRSYTYQEKLFQRWVEIDGLEEAERESARPGTSQHQLGVAIDFGSITDDFALTKQCQWLNENSEKYGWSLSFPQQYEDITGYRWECWHFRYIGAEACKFQKKWFNDVQQYMLEFIDAWKNTTL